MFVHSYGTVGYIAKPTTYLLRLFYRVTHLVNHVYIH